MILNQLVKEHKIWGWGDGSLLRAPLFFQKTGVQIPALHGSSQLSVTPRSDTLT